LKPQQDLVSKNNNATGALSTLATFKAHISI